MVRLVLRGCDIIGEFRRENCRFQEADLSLGMATTWVPLSRWLESECWVVGKPLCQLHDETNRTPR